MAQKEDDPIRKKILAAMDRLLAGKPLRSTGRLSVSQLAVEAGIGRWHLTHQHTDLREMFQAHVINLRGTPAAFERATSEFAELKSAHRKLQAHCTELEGKLRLYASVIQTLALESDAAAQHRPISHLNTQLPRR